MSFLGFPNYYREFNKGYADKIYPMHKLCGIRARSSDGLTRLKSFLRLLNANFVRLQPSACRPTNSVRVGYRRISFAISGILHQVQERKRRTVIRPIAYGSKVLSDTEMKSGAPKADLFAVTFLWKSVYPNCAVLPLNCRHSSSSLAENLFDRSKL